MMSTPTQTALPVSDASIARTARPACPPRPALFARPARADRGTGRRLRALAAMLTWVLGTSLLAPVAQAGDTTPAHQLERFSAAAGAPGQAERGRQFFTSRHGGEWSCASCHGSSPTGTGKHASTGKAIDPLAPAANPKAFTDTARVDKWFRRNCKDVLQRECSAAEKADVIAWLSSLKP